MKSGNFSPRRSAASLMALASIVWLAGCTQMPSPDVQIDPLAAKFTDPPNEARPRVWWHWMNGNVTKDGIQKDLDWMSRVGIGGVQNFDADLFTPVIDEQRTAFMTPDWIDAFRFAVRLADEKGMEFAIAASPGWSETGGPWVPPQDGMKKLVWSEIELPGGQRFNGRLPAPPSTTGRFQDVLMEPSILGPPDPNPPTFYADSAVLAYRLADRIAPLPSPRIRVGNVASDVSAIVDGSYQTALKVARGTAADPATIVFEYPSPITVRSASLALGAYMDSLGAGGSGVTPVLEAERDGAWTRVAELDMRGAPQTTASFAAVTAQKFRFAFYPVEPVSSLNAINPAPGAQTIPIGVTTLTPEFIVRELSLSSEPRVNRFEVKASFGVAMAYYTLDEGLADEPGVPAATVIDLTGHMKPDGQLDWTPPAGRWKVVRLGYSLTGTKNHPASKEGTGLEVDKLDGEAVRRYLETYLSIYRNATGPDLMGERGLNAILTDSIETGPTNWSPAIVEDFKRLRGYDPTPWLPALTGVVIESRAKSDAFLYDFRRTLSDLLSSEHYGVVAKVAHENGLRVYGEAIEGQRVLMSDDLSMRRYADVPMAALWTYSREKGPDAGYVGDIRGAASVANVYGQKYVAAESLTSGLAPWAFAPRDLKTVIDLAFVTGVNRPVIHTSVHQPFDDFQPGLSLFVFGQYFNRHETWAEMAKPWVDYLARTSFMLQQGRSVADVAYFIGEERPSSALARARALLHLPQENGYDFVNADALINELSVEGDEIVAGGGARYRIVYLGGDSHRMTVAVLRKLAVLAESGATIVGVAPMDSPSLSDTRAEFDALVGRLWSGAPTTVIGKGKVIASADLGAALQAIGVRPDFAYDRLAGSREVLFLHRKLDDGEAYFLTNRNAKPESFEGRFRVSGKQPEIWRAETGTVEPVSYRIEGGETVVSLEMKPDDAFFVIFRDAANANAATPPAEAWSETQRLNGDWEVSFQPGRGAPANIRLTSLSPLNEHSDAGVKYFSGVARYRTSMDAPVLRPGQKAKLDLGEIGDVAEVYVNGTLAGTAWHAPNEVDITSVIRPGRNEIEIRVANLWVNRLIGDQQPGATKITSTTAPTYTPEAPLRRSGLIGPVVLKTTH